jgi:hypothetical protein
VRLVRAASRRPSSLSFSQFGSSVGRTESVEDFTPAHHLKEARAKMPEDDFNELAMTSDLTPFMSGKRATV